MPIYTPTVEYNLIQGSDITISSTTDLLTFIKESAINKYTIDAIDIQALTFDQLSQKITYVLPHPDGTIQSESKQLIPDVYQYQAGLKNLGINHWIITGVSYILYTVLPFEKITIVFKMNQGANNADEFKKKMKARSTFDMVHDIPNAAELAEPCDIKPNFIEEMVEKFGNPENLKKPKKGMEQPIPEPKKVPYTGNSPFGNKSNVQDNSQSWAGGSTGAKGKEGDSKIPWSSIRRGEPNRMNESVELDPEPRKVPLNKPSPFNQNNRNMEQQFQNFAAQDTIDGGATPATSAQKRQKYLKTGLMVAGAIFVGLIVWGLISKKKNVTI
jgi:hypothetical protein